MVGALGMDEMRWQHVGVEAPDAHAQLADEQSIFPVHLDAVRARDAAR